MDCRRGLPAWWVARLTVVLALLTMACAAAAFSATSATAHPLSSTAVVLDVGPEEVTGQVAMPIDRLDIALTQNLTPTDVLQPAKLAELRQYVLDHTSVTDPGDGAAWATSVTGGSVENIDGVDHLVFDITLLPPDGHVTDFQFHYDAIVEHLLSHRIFVSARPVGTDTYTAVGVIDWQTQTLTVPVQSASAEQGFLAAVKLGNQHIAEGADHLLFLIMLLLPAPLLARRGRWVRTNNMRRSCWRIVHVVTAFAVGHSITLALAAFGLVTVPARVVESLIALSILVSGIHAIRPLAKSGEVWIASVFGLMHGLAFATLLGQLDLSRGSLVTELLGFNLGIELTQLIVVALLMPSLLLLSRTTAYTPIRVSIAGVGIVLAATWLAERTTLIPTSPFEFLSDAFVAHPFVVSGAVAAVAVTIWCIPQLRYQSAPEPRTKTTRTTQPTSA
jgi:hypothetical protein